MIQQPELGRKIADLRKAKCLTQEELVEKCNLNVRTLQRIESGEGTPRTSTIRLIFGALDYSFDESQDDHGFRTNLTEQFYRSLIDLFNLKTNTMKKLSILTMLVMGVVLGLFTFVTNGEAQDNSRVPQKENLNDHPELKLVDKNLSCVDYFYDNDELIGYGVQLNKDGVKANVNLIRLNTKTGEFNAGFISGVFLNNKVELRAKEEWIYKELVTYEAQDEAAFFDDKLILKGDAKLMSAAGECIEAEEIIYFFE